MNPVVSIRRGNKRAELVVCRIVKGNDNPDVQVVCGSSRLTITGSSSSITIIPIKTSTNFRIHITRDYWDNYEELYVENARWNRAESSYCYYPITKQGRDAVVVFSYTEN